ncbi:Protein of unknown function [Propionibacterium freudenreichii]|nr:Protein of unknown function [Propionibacterium freudenreichii]
MARGRPPQLRRTAWPARRSRSSGGRAKLSDSSTRRSSSARGYPNCASRAITPSTSSSGTDAPLVTPTVLTPSNQSGSISSALSTRRACFAPDSRATSTRRTELDEFCEPTTITRSECLAMSFTADCRFWVA